MNKFLEIIKIISKKAVSEPNSEKNRHISTGTNRKISNLINQNLIEIINENEKKERNNGNLRYWRFIPNNSFFMNNITTRLIDVHKLKYMNSVCSFINEINKIQDNDLIGDYNLVVFVDIDNWGRFFQLPSFLPPKTFIYSFKGGKNLWRAPIGYAKHRHI